MGIESLFRPEAVEHKRRRDPGTILLVRPIALPIMATIAILVGSAIALFAYFGKYTRSAPAVGFTAPQAGLFRVVAPIGGTIVRTAVGEGAEVRRGDVLYALSGEIVSRDAGRTQEGVGRILSGRRATLESEEANQRNIFKTQRDTLTSQRKLIEEGLAKARGEHALAERRTKIAGETLERFRSLQESKFISPAQLQEKEGEHIDQQIRLEGLKRVIATLERDLATVDGELQQLPKKEASQIASLHANIAMVNQESVENAARQEVLVSAPIDGRLSGAVLQPGALVGAGSLLSNLVPSDAKMEVHLFAPSRSIGFIREGMKVRLRYQAYPYQKFGHHPAVVRHVSHSPITPQDLAAASNGLITAQEPLYRIIVTPERGEITLYGKASPIMPGLNVDADIELDERRLYEWVLEPLYTLTGRA